MQVYEGKFNESQILAIKIKKKLQENQEYYKQRLMHALNHLKRCEHENVMFFGFEEITENI